MKKFFPVMGALLVVSLISCSDGTTTPKLVVPDKRDKASEKLDLTKEGLVSQLDVLFVVDDSGSMDSKQQMLAANIDLFTREFTKTAFVDYHVGVITSSMGAKGSYECGSYGCNGLLVGPPLWIERSTPNGIADLQKNFLVGTNGSGEEQFFDPVIKALSKPLVDNENKGFYRPRAHLAIIFVTDADDQSRSKITPDGFIDFLTKLKGAADKFSVYGAYIPTADSSCSRGGEDYPRRLEEVFAKTNSLAVSLCDPQFGAKLAGVGKDLFRRIARTMYLSRKPERGTIKVYYGNVLMDPDVHTGWTFLPDQNAIKFGDNVDWDSQPIGTPLNIEYTPMP